jgi:hypothetical protein
VTAYLIDHPPRRTQFKARGTTISGVVVLHTAESLPDFDGPDVGAEGVARFIQGRGEPGSYHWLADSDSLIDLVPMREYQAYGDGTGSNSHAIHISAATQAHRWSGLPDWWVDATVENMALAAHKASSLLEDVHGVRIPARRVTKAESDRRVEGFIAHGTRDPGRRSDPGEEFPWSLFFEVYRDLENPAKAEAEVTRTRGRNVDLALRHVAAAITAADKAKGPGARGAKLDAAGAELVEARKILRSIALTTPKEGA